MESLSICITSSALTGYALYRHIKFLAMFFKLYDPFGLGGDQQVDTASVALYRALQELAGLQASLLGGIQLITVFILLGLMNKLKPLLDQGACKGHPFPVGLLDSPSVVAIERSGLWIGLLVFLLPLLVVFVEGFLALRPALLNDRALWHAVCTDLHLNFRLRWALSIAGSSTAIMDAYVPLRQQKRKPDREAG